MFRNEKEEKFVDKMIKNSIMRKSKYFRRNLCINLKQTTIKIIKIKNIDDLKTKLLGLHIWDINSCFFLTHTNFYPNNILNCNVDVVFTDKNHKVISCHKNIDPTWELKLDKAENVWIFLLNQIEKLNIKIGDILYTQS